VLLPSTTPSSSSDDDISCSDCDFSLSLRFFSGELSSDLFIVGTVSCLLEKLK
jgi:hypothetical protein